MTALTPVGALGLRTAAGLADWRITDVAWVQVFGDVDHAGQSALNFAVDDLEDKTISRLADRLKR
ncbi:hypothetical protein [Frankia sp. EAN1pec]|uniref:hypothetical protein n=1 Tax=Parafrankia sp. (strain EAN1pec) TaxID=298653 RepID=UPI0000542174